MDGSAPRLWTIGHSTREWPVFMDMLRAAGITTVVDVRRFAASRRHPQFDGATMAQALPRDDIAYVALPGLGGRRRALPGSRNTAWRNAGFRGYADYMATPPWQSACASLAGLARQGPTAILCAEALWWQCHRALVADWFKAAGWSVVHLTGPGRSEAHPYTAAARIVDGALDYSQPPPAQPGLFPDSQPAR